MSKVEWNGVYPAVTTKFTADEQIDIPAFIKNIEAQIEAGVSGIILGGTLGEASTLTDEEKRIFAPRNGLIHYNAGQRWCS